MPTKIVDGYELDFTSQKLEGCSFWGAYVTIYMPSSNPMHMDTIFARQRVSADLRFPDEASATAEAESAALKILDGLRQGGAGKVIF